jgi:phospholipase/carboxylesterase
LAGVLALSTYLLRPATLAVERTEANAGIPIFQAHGDHDPMVPPEMGLAARRELTGLGYPVEWKTYPMAHEVHPAELRDIGVALNRMLGADRA